MYSPNLTEPEIEAKLQRGFDNFQPSALNIDEMDYLKVIFQEKGDKEKIFEQLLKGAVEKEQRAKRWLHFKTLEQKDLIYEVRDDQNHVVEYRYHPELVPIFHKRFPHLFEEHFKSVTETILSLPIPVSPNSEAPNSFFLSANFKVPNNMYLKAKTPYKLILKRVNDQLQFEIETVV